MNEREKLFRGKRCNSNEWIEGYYYSQTWLEYPDWIRTTKDFHFIDIAVIPETVGQFTGYEIKDKKLFKGDIIKTSSFTYSVVFENGAFYLYHTTLKDWDETPLRWGLLSRLFDSDVVRILGFAEIIGNIHDNQELLIK